MEGQDSNGLVLELSQIPYAKWERKIVFIVMYFLVWKGLGISFPSALSKLWQNTARFHDKADISKNMQSEHCKF